MEPTLSQQPPNHNKAYPLNFEAALLNMSRALWNEVSSTLRAVRLKWNKDRVHIYFYYDGEISELDRESSECIATEFIASYYEYELIVDIIRLDYPLPIPRDGYLVYYRSESIPCAQIQMERELLEQMRTKAHSTFWDAELSLSVFIELIGKISPSLRSVRIKLDKNMITIIFYNDGLCFLDEISSFEHSKEKLALQFPEYIVQTEIIRLDAPTAIPKTGILIFKRREP